MQAAAEIAGATGAANPSTSSGGAVPYAEVRALESCGRFCEVQSPLPGAGAGRKATTSAGAPASVEIVLFAFAPPSTGQAYERVRERRLHGRSHRGERSGVRDRGGDRRGGLEDEVSQPRHLLGECGGVLGERGTTRIVGGKRGCAQLEHDSKARRQLLERCHESRIGGDGA